jgi:hypothetical protein
MMSETKALAWKASASTAKSETPTPSTNNI